MTSQEEAGGVPAGVTSQVIYCRYELAVGAVVAVVTFIKHVLVKLGWRLHVDIFSSFVCHVVLMLCFDWLIIGTWCVVIR